MAFYTWNSPDSLPRGAEPRALGAYGGEEVVPAHWERPGGPRPTEVKSMTNFSSGRADSRTFFGGAVSPLLGSPSFRFPFLYSLFRTPRATRWGAALAGSRFPTHYLRTLWKYANGKRSVVRNAPYTSSWKAAHG